MLALVTRAATRVGAPFFVADNNLARTCLYLNPSYERTTSAHTSASRTRILQRSIGRVRSLQIPRLRARALRFDFDFDNRPREADQHAHLSAGLPRTRKPSRSRGVFTMIALRFERVFSLREDMHDSYSRPAVTTQLEHQTSMVAKMKTRKRPCHDSAVIETLFEDVR